MGGNVDKLIQILKLTLNLSILGLELTYIGYLPPDQCHIEPHTEPMEIIQKSITGIFSVSFGMLH